MRQVPHLKAILVLAMASSLAVLSSGCTLLATEPTSTASTMTHSPPDYQPESQARRPARRYRQPSTTAAQPAGAAYTGAAASAATTAPARPRSRADRALDVLRRSPLGRLGRSFRRAVVGPASLAPVSAAPAVQPTAASSEVIVGQPMTTGSGIRSTVTGTPTEPIPGVTPRLTQPTTAAASTPAPPPQQQVPGAGRVIVGQPVDTGSGIKSTVTGTPIEPIPGVTPASTQVVPTTTTAPTAVRGTAAAASAPTTVAPSLGTPPPDVIAPAEPAPGTTVTNTAAVGAPVKVTTNPDGTPVITNEEAAEEAAKRKAAEQKKKKRRNQ